MTLAADTAARAWDRVARRGREGETVTLDPAEVELWSDLARLRGVHLGRGLDGSPSVALDPAAARSTLPAWLYAHPWSLAEELGRRWGVEGERSLGRDLLGGGLVPVEPPSPLARVRRRWERAAASRELAARRSRP